MSEMTRDEEIKAIWKNPDTRLFYKLMGAALLVVMGVFVGRLIYATPEADQAWGYGVNLFTGVISTLATVLILDQLAERRAERKAEDALKRQLVDDAASLSREIAVNAVHQLRRKHWLEGENGLLQGADLWNTNLQDADLDAANLQKAELFYANLQGARLWEANLQGARLGNANLSEASFTLANLHGADLSNANLQRTHLNNTNLQHANLRRANLQDAQLAAATLRGADLYRANLLGATLPDAAFDTLTRLPDGSLWTSETDVNRFIDPDHADFWQPEWVKQQAGTD